MQKDNEIRTLRAQHKQKEMILKRKQEEVRYPKLCKIFKKTKLFVLGTFITTSNAFSSST
jgi:hypothetical protein